MDRVNMVRISKGCGGRYRLTIKPSSQYRKPKVISRAGGASVRSPKHNSKLTSGLSKRIRNSSGQGGEYSQDSLVLEYGATALYFAGGVLFSGVAGCLLFRPMVDTLVQFNPVKFPIAFTGQVSGFVSILFSILVGDTLQFLQDRQTDVTRCVYDELYGLERCIFTVTNRIKDQPVRDFVASQLRQYVELHLIELKQSSPFCPSGPVGVLLKELPGKLEGEVGIERSEKIMDIFYDFAEKFSARQAASVKLLPPAHWILVILVGLLLLINYVISGPSLVQNQQLEQGSALLFGLCSGLFVGVMMVLYDLSIPDGGVYTFKDDISSRMQGIEQLLEGLEMPSTGVQSQES